MTRLDIYANRAHLTAWSHGAKRSRWDYDTPDYTFDDMLLAGDRLFGRCIDMLRSGDLIYVTEANNRRFTLIIGLIDEARNTVVWDIDVVHAERIVMPTDATYTIRHRGRGNFAIIDADGSVVMKGLASREEAEREIAAMVRSAAA